MAQLDQQVHQFAGLRAIEDAGVVAMLAERRMPLGVICLALWDGDGVGWRAAAVSFLLTWLLAWLQVRMLMGQRRAANA